MPGYWLTLILFTCKFLHILTCTYIYLHIHLHSPCARVWRAMSGSRGGARLDLLRLRWGLWGNGNTSLFTCVKTDDDENYLFLLAIKKEKTKTVPAAIFCRVSVEIVNRAEQMAWVVKWGIYLHIRRIVYLLWSNQPGLKEFRDDSRMSSTLLVFGQLIPYSYSSLDEIKHNFHNFHYCHNQFEPSSLF